MSEPLAAQTSEDVQADAEELSLQTPHGAITALVRTNWDCARTLYEVSGPRVSGCLTVYPYLVPLNHEVMPSGITITFGDLLAGQTHRQFDPYTLYPRPTKVNTIAVLGYNTTTVSVVSNGSFSTWTRRKVSDTMNGRLPDAAQERLTSVTTAVLRHWLERPDLAELRLIVARAEVPGRLANERHKISKIQGEIDKLKTDRQLHQDRAEDFRRFLDEQGLPHRVKESV